MSADPIISDEYKYGFSQPENYVFKSRKGLDHDIVEQISQMKHEPQWLNDFRHRSLDLFLKRPMPNWGGELDTIDFQDIYYYIKPMQDSGTTWEDVPADIRDTFDKLGIPEAERKFLAGVGSQYECLSGDTRVYTARGLVPIRDIVVGDTVFSFDENENRIIAAKVRATAEKGEREVFEVRVGNRVIRSTANHPFLNLAYDKEEGRIRGRYHREWTYLSDLSVGDLVGVVKDLPETGTDYHLEQPVIKTEVTGHNLAATSTATLARIARVEFGDYVKIDSITPAGTEMVYDIEVEGPHNFVAEGLIVHNSEVVYHKVRADLEAKGVIFVDPDTAFREHEEIFRPYFATVIPPNDNKFAALNSAVFSGGSFIYVPKGVSIDLPLQAYFRINAQNMGQFERTLIIADEGSYVHYVEGCFTAGARVRTRDGEKLIEEIREGDEVFTHKGRYRKVTHTMQRPYQGDIYHIALAAHTLHVTEEHPLMIVRNPADRVKGEQPLLEWVFASQVKAGDYLVAPSDKAASIQVAPQDFWRADDRFTYLPVQSITTEQMDTTVYNLSVDEDETYVAEGVISHNCTAPTYTTDSLHSAVVEIIVKRDARVRYTTIQNWSKNVYNLVTKRAQAYANATMEWVDSNLGCLSEGSTVTTPDGIKPIEDLQVGDKVLSYDDSAGELTFRAVTAKRFSGMQPVHTVSVGERKIHVTANHPFYSYKHELDDGKQWGRYHLDYVRTDQLQEVIIPHTSIDYGQPYVLQVPTLTTAFNSLNQYAPELSMSRSRASRMTATEYTDDSIMWLFGYWVGDGNIELKQGKTEGVMRWAKVGFSTPREDRARGRLVETMTALVDATPHERADGHHLYWSSKELAEFFHLNGFKGNARTKRVPQWVWSLPESQRLAFIAGYIDADGCVIRGQLHIKSVNRQLLEDVASLLVTVGITPRLRTEFSEPKQVVIMGVPTIAHGAYTLTFRSDERLLKHTSTAIQNKALDQQRTSHTKRAIGRSEIHLPDAVEIVPVTVSEPSADPVPTWDIEVEGTGNFVADGFIVHNSKLTMKYPAVWLMEPGAKGDVLSVAFASDGQHQDAGGKMVHVAPHTSSTIVSKSISKGAGRSSYRGLLKVQKGAHHVKSNVRCDALLLDEQSRTDTYPYMEIEEEDVEVGHEASVSKVGEEQLFYLMSRGISEGEAYTMIVSGFIEPIVKELPLEYAVELNRLIQLEMSGSVG